MTSPAVARLVRAAAGVVCAGLLLGGSGPALAAGTGGIEVTPIPAVVDGRLQTTFRADVPAEGTRRVAFALRNITEGQRAARVYAALAQRQQDGTITVGAPGSSRNVVLPEERVELKAEELQQRAFTVTGPLERDALAAVVVEVRQGSVVQRAATLVYLSPEGDLPIPLLLGLGAAAVALVTGVGVVLVSRRRREPEPDRT